MVEISKDVNDSNELVPLAEYWRPDKLEDFVGQKHLLSPGGPLWQMWQKKRLYSMIFWGPPGTGKTTLARLLAKNAEINFISLSAILAGVKEIKSLAEQTVGTVVVFVDEIHRFNKAQQDAFLPWVENGRLILIGATTENPSFELNSALLSRARVFVLKPLAVEEIVQILKRISLKIELLLSDEELGKIAKFANGDARKAIGFLEIYQDFAKQHSKEQFEQLLIEVLNAPLAFDKKGEYFYDQISALHKAMRGSSPDAALYWYTRMIKGGCPPLYIARRLIRFASEDIGNADLNALTLALNAVQAYERLGSPEGELAIAQAVIYLAVAPKSNAVYKAFNRMKEFTDVDLPVPLYLRNAPTKLMKELGYSKNYQYPHDYPSGYVPGVNYFPEGFSVSENFYQPVERGLEIKIKERISFFKKLDNQKIK